MLSKVNDALIDAVQFIDAVRQDTIAEGWWTEWDQKMRGKITSALQQIDRLRSTPCAVPEEEIERLRKIETAARALKFSAYPAHGQGFVIQVSGGNINDLEAALAASPPAPAVHDGDKPAEKEGWEP